MFANEDQSHYTGNKIGDNLSINKPFYLKDYLTVSNQSFDASVLYTKIDLYLSTKRVWRREVKGLLEDLGITSERYKKLAHRRKKAEEFIEIL